MSQKIKERREIKKQAEVEANNPKVEPKKTLVDKIKSIFKKK